MYEFEKKKLYSYLGKNLLEALKNYGAYIAGGTITSLFCNREINDIDIYFRDQESFVDFITEIWDEGKWIVSHTKKATLLKYNELDVQLIHLGFFNTPEDIFNTFDFTVCMGCFDFSTEEFVLHEDFMKHNSQRLLKFNEKTLYPIVSALRVQKYEKKGYKISKPEYIRILLSCMRLNIATYEELKEQMGGMYGVNYDKLFEKQEEFSLDTAIEQIKNLVYDDDYFKKPESVEINDIEDIIDNVLDGKSNYIQVGRDFYRITKRGVLKELRKAPNNGIKIDAEEYFKNKKFYKFVQKRDDKYFSFYDSKFEYIIEEEVTAKGNNYTRTPSLFCGELVDVRSFTYCNKKDGVLIELAVNLEDFKFKKEKAVEIKKCKVIREVPEEEYSDFL